MTDMANSRCQAPGVKKMPEGTFKYNRGQSSEAAAKGPCCSSRGHRCGWLPSPHMAIFNCSPSGLHTLFWLQWALHACYTLTRAISPRHRPWTDIREAASQTEERCVIWTKSGFYLGIRPRDYNLNVALTPGFVGRTGLGVFHWSKTWTLRSSAVKALQRWESWGQHCSRMHIKDTHSLIFNSSVTLLVHSTEPDRTDEQTKQIHLQLKQSLLRGVPETDRAGQPSPKRQWHFHIHHRRIGRGKWLTV